VVPHEARLGSCTGARFTVKPLITRLHEDPPSLLFGIPDRLNGPVKTNDVELITFGDGHRLSVIETSQRLGVKLKTWAESKSDLHCF